MNAVAEEALGAVPLLNAVFCINCETISTSRHDACKICGSRSLINLCRVLGGTLWNRNQLSSPEHGKYRLELTARVSEIEATDLNLLSELLMRLAEASGRVETLHLDVEPAIADEHVLKAA